MRVLGFCILLSLCAQAQMSAPKPYAGGEFWVRNENTWFDWEVTSNDLVGRLTPDWPADDEVAGALLNIDWTVNRWPAVAHFHKGDHLRIRPDSVGGFLIKDFNGSSWMKVDLGDGRICFVRANSKCVKPCAPPPAAIIPVVGGGGPAAESGVVSPVPVESAQEISPTTP